MSVPGADDQPFSPPAWLCLLGEAELAGADTPPRGGDVVLYGSGDRAAASSPGCHPDIDTLIHW